jgi:hypothetical protein
MNPLFSPSRRLYEPEANIPVFHYPTAFVYVIRLGGLPLTWLG